MDEHFKPLPPGTTRAHFIADNDSVSIVSSAVPPAGAYDFGFCVIIDAQPSLSVNAINMMAFVTN